MKKNVNASQYSVDIQGERLPVILRKHRTSRRIVIRYQPLQHLVSVTLPRYATIRQGLNFLAEKENWIASEIEKHSRRIALSDGQAIPVLGKHYTLCHIGGRGLVRLEEGRILVPGELQFMPRRVREWLKEMLRQEIDAIAQPAAARLGKKINRISLRETTTLWGSCNHLGNLSFSWRLVFAPREVLDYIVCHEVAHLQELNHSKEFWRVVGSLCPEWERWYDWIRAHGAELYSYQ